MALLPEGATFATALYKNIALVTEGEFALSCIAHGDDNRVNTSNTSNHTSSDAPRSLHAAQLLRGFLLRYDCDPFQL
jgi:hypothetical protein